MAVVALACALTSTIVARARGAAVLPRLEAADLCEASGARFVPCTGRFARCVLIADNEVRDRVFLFGVDEPAKRLEFIESVSLGVEEDAGPKDLEALELANDRLWLVSSHSHKAWKPDKKCKRDDERLALARGSWTGEGIRGTQVFSADAELWKTDLRKDCGAKILVAPRGDRATEPLAATVCARLGKADRHADDSKHDCEQALNIEGAASVPGDDGTPRLWLGLRAPTVDEHAILIRWASGDDHTFDGVATVNLDGLGIRDLAVAVGRLWIVAGPVGDSDTSHALYRVRLSAVQSGRTIERPDVARVMDLPSYAEGLALDPGRLDGFVVIDGDEKACEANPPRYLHINLDAPRMMCE